METLCLDYGKKSLGQNLSAENGVRVLSGFEIIKSYFWHPTPRMGGGAYRDRNTHREESGQNSTNEQNITMIKTDFWTVAD